MVRVGASPVAAAAGATRPRGPEISAVPAKPAVAARKERRLKGSQVMSHLRVGGGLCTERPTLRRGQTVNAARAAECGAAGHQMTWMEVATPALVFNRAADRSSGSDGSLVRARVPVDPTGAVS